MLEITKIRHSYAFSVNKKVKASFSFDSRLT